MAEESYYERRRRELGIGVTSKGGSNADSPSFYDSRRMDLGLIPDTRPKPKAFENNAQSPEQWKQTTTERLFPQQTRQTTGYVQPTKEAAQHFIKAAATPEMSMHDRETQWFNEQKKKRQRANVGKDPDSLGSKISKYGDLLPQAINALELAIPGVAEFEHGANAMMGFDTHNLPPSSNGIGGKIIKGAGAVAASSINPAALEQSLITGPYKAAQGIVSTLLPKAGKLVQRAATGSLAGTGTGAAYSLISGQSDADEVAKNAALGGVIGGIGDVAIGALGDVIGRLLKRNGVPAEHAQEILTPTKTESVDIANTPNKPQLALPSPTLNAPTKARIARRVNPYREQFEQLIRDAQKSSLTPGREDLDLEQMWAQRAGREGVSLDELIQRAYPSKPSLLTPDTLQRAKTNQQWRQVVGAPLPVKSLEERYPLGGNKGEAAAPRTVFARTDNNGERVIPKIKIGASSLQDGAINSGEAQNYAGNRIAFRSAAAQNERTISRNKIVNNIRKNLGVVIDTGRLSGGKNVLGQFKITPEVVRTRMAEDLQVISHEVGHNLDKRFKLKDDPQFHQELANVAQNNATLNLAAYQPHQIPEEGVAEYVRLRLTDPDTARILAPNFTKYFDSRVDAKTLKGLEASAADIDTWITQGDYNQAMGLIDFDSSKGKQGFSFDRTYSKFVDDLHPLKLVEKALKGVVGVGKESIYKMARLSRGVGERAKLAITRGIYDESGNKISEGLREIVQPLEKIGVSEKDLSLYLAIRHAQDLKAQGKQVPWTDNHIRAVMQKLDSPEMRKVQQGIIKFNNHLLDILVDAQILTRKSVQDMQAKHPNYVPFFRYFDDDAIAGFKNGGFGGSKGFANIGNPIKAMTEEGSTRTVINPIESIVKNTMLVMNAAAKNKVGLQLSELSKIEGAGNWVEHLGEGGASTSEHVVSVYEKGVRQSYKVRDADLYNAMLSLDTESTNSLIKFLGGAASMLRAGAVLTPEFTVRNAFRDILGATINSVQYGFNPVDFAKGMFHVLGKTKTFDQFLSSGGAMSTIMSLDRDASREAMEAVFRKSLKNKALNVVTSPKELAKMLSGYTPAKKVIGGLRKATEVSELSTKVGAFNKALKKSGSIEEAAYTARDLMDFNRAGTSIRQANRAVAFMNAAIQGTDKMARSFMENKTSFLTRATATLVVPAIGLYFWNKNLPEDMKAEYENIPQWQKDNFFIVGIPGANVFARIPKPFEAGMLFSTGTERVLDWLHTNDPEAFKNYGRTLLSTFTPPVMLTALTPLLEAITNHSFFRNAPIVSQGEQRFEKKDQYGIYTSETAKGVGAILSQTPLKESNFASPRIIDNTIKGYTAGLGQYAVSGLDAAINGIRGKQGPTRPAKEWQEQAFTKSFFVNTAGGGQVRDEFYKQWERLSTKKASSELNGTPFHEPTYVRMHSANKVITKLNKLYKDVQKDEKMSATEKRAKLDVLDAQMNQVAEKGLGK